MSETRKLVGEVVVTSGQLMVVDPSVVQNSWDSLTTYEDCCAASASANRSGEVLNDRAFAFNAEFGDGHYQIFSVKNEDGAVVRMEIMMSPEEEDDTYDEDDEDWLPEDDDEEEFGD